MLPSLLVSIGFCTLTTCGFLLASDPVAHWFVIPVWLGGVLIGRDAVDWLRGRVKLLDPAGVIGLIGLHFFFLAPLLQVAWGASMLYVDPPPDWRPWLGGMAVSAVLQAWVYASYGGISGYIDAFTESFGVPEAQSAFVNMGWVFALSE